MKNYRLVLLLWYLLGICGVVCSQEIEWREISGEHRDIRFALIDKDNPQIIYMAAKGSVLVSSDLGKNWREVFCVKGKNKVVNFLSFHPGNKNYLYAASGEGLFFSRNQGKNWARVFRGKDFLENNCISLIIIPQGLYLGTKGGLFYSQDQGRFWKRIEGKLGKAGIFALATSKIDPATLYAVSTEGVFKSINYGKNWQNIFVGISKDGAPEAEEAEELPQEPQGNSDINYIAVNANDPRQIYLAGKKGVYLSQNKGLNWELLSGFGLLSQEAKIIMLDGSSGIYIANKSGIFIHQQSRWQELSLRLVFKEIRHLALDREGGFYACCDSGLFKLFPKTFDNMTRLDLRKIYSKNEPSIREVQLAAIKYAEVEPEKITRWRKLAAKKAILPKFSAGVGRDTSDLWHWETGSSTKTCDDALVRGKETLDWDLTLTWDLSEIVWSEAQTSIDVRSRLTAQLREDILDEVTKLYFERIRVKMEMDSLALEEAKKIMDKELRLQELTAQLDALTGGYFSRYCQENAGSI